MKLSDLNKGQRLLLERAKKGEVPERLGKQMIDAHDGKVNPLIDKNGNPARIHLVDDTYDGLDDRVDVIEFNHDLPEARVIALLVDKMGGFGGLYFTCLTFFKVFPRKKAENKWRYFFRTCPKELLEPPHTEEAS